MPADAVHQMRFGSNSDKRYATAKVLADAGVDHHQAYFESRPPRAI
ncbi:hypothetical protein [Streptomyces longisporoflavus]|uniref:Uncharacterized protein n=1 Tax=Streptomyces longisporoflavus TaxID=28044 RepID=A0ABW7QZJ0_9ACTN